MTTSHPPIEEQNWMENTLVQNTAKNIASTWLMCVVMIAKQLPMQYLKETMVGEEVAVTHQKKVMKANPHR